MSTIDILGERLQAARKDPLASFNGYQLSLQGLSYPVTRHLAFSAVAAASLALVGAPKIGVAFFAACAVFDIVTQWLYARWLSQSPRADVTRGFNKVALTVGLRSMLWLSAPATAAVLNPTPASVGLLGVNCCAVLALAQAYGCYSRRVFWAMAGPTLITIGAAVVLASPTLGVGGVLLALASLTVTLTSISYISAKSVQHWQATHNSKMALIDDLAAAHDRAVQARAAADEAREKARRADQAKSAFLATMSHEIRTPMNGVLGMAELLRREETNPAQMKRLETLISSGEYLMSILNDILDFSKIDAGHVEIANKPEDLQGFLGQLVTFWGPKADEKRLSLQLDADPSVPPAVEMDQLRLRQIMFNLIGNALKFTDSGSVTLRARALNITESKMLVCLAVIDTGPGIAEETIPLLFDRFSQGAGARTTSAAGTGLGLAIARQLCELMGGRIWVESKLGKGSTFHVELPLRLASLPCGPAANASDADADQELPPLRVLAVDDNAVNLLVLEQLLDAFGHRVTKASGGAEALALLASQPFDVVLMDIQMPGMSGTETLAALRGGGGINAAAPVVALTADVVSGGRGHYLGLGFDGHAAKPIQITALIEAIAQAVSSGSEDGGHQPVGQQVA